MCVLIGMKINVIHFYQTQNTTKKTMHEIIMLNTTNYFIPIIMNCTRNGTKIKLKYSKPI